MKFLRYILVILLPAIAVPAWAEIPTVLTDTIKGGDGVIDIFKDVNRRRVRGASAGRDAASGS
jgi:hypothetical protein